MNISETEKCTFCKETDFIEHFFIDCKQLNAFWRHVSNVITEMTSHLIPLSTEIILFGARKPDVPNIPRRCLKALNHIILIAKMSISKFKYGKMHNLFTIFEIELNLRRRYLLQDMDAVGT